MCMCRVWLEKTGCLKDMITCTGHHKLSGQAKDTVVHVELNDDGNRSFVGRHRHLEHNKDTSVSREHMVRAETCENQMIMMTFYFLFWIFFYRRSFSSFPLHSTLKMQRPKEKKKASSSTTSSPPSWLRPHMEEKGC